MATFASAWYVDSPEATATLAAKGFNAFIIPSVVPNLETILNTIPLDSIGVIGLGDCGVGADFAISMNLITSLKGHPKVFGYLTFDEPNISGITVSTQAVWYQAIKAIDPSLYVIVDYYYAGIPYDSDYVAPAPGSAYDVAMVDYYPLHWGQSYNDSVSLTLAAIQATKNFFSPTTPIAPIQQAAWNSTNIPGGLSPISADQLMLQYMAWKVSGCLDVSKAFCYYGWKSNPEDHNLSNDFANLDAASAVATYHHASFQV